MARPKTPEFTDIDLVYKHAIISICSMAEAIAFQQTKIEVSMHNFKTEAISSQTKILKRAGN